MRMVDIKCTLSLDEGVADFVDKLISNGSLPSEIAYYLTQRSNGGYIVNQSEIDDIVDGILEDSNERSQRGVIEDAVRTALTEFLAQGSININNIVGSAKETDSKVDDINNEAVIEDTDIMTFECNENDGESMSDEDASDLADFFGF